MTVATFHLPNHWATGRVAITLIGAGGTGSDLAVSLASMETTLRALGHPGFDVTVADGDAVSESNVARQRYTRADIGANKSAVLVHRINAFHGLQWNAYPRHVEVDHDRPHTYADLIITAVDKAAFRAELGQAYSNRHSDALWLDLGNGPDPDGGGDRGNVILGHLGKPDGAMRLPNVYDLYPELASMQAVDREAPSCSAAEAIQRQAWPVNRAASLIGTELLWTLFRSGSIQTHGAFFRLAPLTIQPLQIDPVAWAFMGYSDNAAANASKAA